MTRTDTAPVAASVSKVGRKRLGRNAVRVGRGLTWYMVNVVLVLLFVTPLLSAFTVAMTPQSELFGAGRAVLWPHDLTLENVKTVWEAAPFLRWYANSLMVSSLFTIGQLISCSLTAYALARIDFRGRGLLMVVVTATMMLPFQTLMIPMLQLMKTLHLVNTDVALWLPAFFGDVTGAFGIFLLRQAFLSVPADLTDAAMVDGANPFQVFLRVNLPLVAPQLAVVGVFAFMNSWNDFIRPIVYIADKELMTVTGGLSYFQTAFHVEWGPLMAGALLSAVPTLILYVFAQRYFVEAVATSGLK